MSDYQRSITYTVLRKWCGNDLVAEHRFCDGRRWRFDFAILSAKVAIEIEGAVWCQGRHTRGSGFVKDMEKYNAAAVLGWRVLRYTPQQWQTNVPLADVHQIIYGRKL